MIPKNIAEEFFQCNKCGLCAATCPIGKELLLEKYTPRGKIQLARYYSQGKLDLSDHCREVFVKCLLCGACMTTCPSGVELNKVFISLRGEITKNIGVHPMMEKAVESLVVHHNISDEDNSERGEWKDFLKNPPPHAYEKSKAEVVYFVGCVASFFPMVQKIPQQFVQILEMANVDFSLLGGEEWCCGFPLIGAGALEKSHDLIKHNLQKIKELGANRVVFSCPSCYRTWKERYNADVEILHSTQLIQKLIEERAIRLGTVNTAVTYHDPCDLGRSSSVFDAPRRILKAIPGLKLVELENTRMKSVCCGGGGNVEMADPNLSGAVAEKKLEEIQRTGATTVVTSCQQCVRTIKSRARRQDLDLEVLDITELVLKAISLNRN